MNCDKFMQCIDAYFDGELDSQTAKEFEEHNLSCEDCSLVYESYDNMLKSLKDLEQEEIPLPKGLHENIMKSVNAVAKANVAPDIIDITQHIETNEENNRPEIKVVKDFTITTESYFTKRRVNTLVAGFLTLFIGTGTYTTYDRLQNPVTTEEPLININYSAIEEATTEETETAPAEEVELFSADSTEAKTESQDNVDVANDSVAISTGTTTAETDELAQNSTVSTESVTESVSEPIATTQSPKVQAAPQSAPAVQSRMLNSSQNNELVISVNNSDSKLIQDYLEYLSNSPDIEISDIQDLGGEYHLTATSNNIDNFIFYAQNFSEFEKDTLNLSYSDETLAKIKELQEFQIKLVQN